MRQQDFQLLLDKFSELAKSLPAASMHRHLLKQDLKQQYPVGNTERKLHEQVFRFFSQSLRALEISAKYFCTRQSKAKIDSLIFMLGQAARDHAHLIIPVTHIARILNATIHQPNNHTVDSTLKACIDSLTDNNDLQAEDSTQAVPLQYVENLANALQTVFATLQSEDHSKALSKGNADQKAIMHYLTEHDLNSELPDSVIISDIHRFCRCSTFELMHFLNENYGLNIRLASHDEVANYCNHVLAHCFVNQPSLYLSRLSAQSDQTIIADLISELLHRCHDEFITLRQQFIGAGIKPETFSKALIKCGGDEQEIRSTLIGSNDQSQPLPAAAQPKEKLGRLKHRSVRFNFNNNTVREIPGRESDLFRTQTPTIITVV